MTHLKAWLLQRRDDGVHPPSAYIVCLGFLPILAWVAGVFGGGATNLSEVGARFLGTAGVFFLLVFIATATAKKLGWGDIFGFAAMFSPALPLAREPSRKADENEKDGTTQGKHPEGNAQRVSGEHWCDNKRETSQNPAQDGNYLAHVSPSPLNPLELRLLSGIREEARAKVGCSLRDTVPR